MRRSKWMQKALSIVTAATLTFSGLTGLMPVPDVSAAERVVESFDSVALELTQATDHAGRVNLTYKGSTIKQSD